MRGLHTYFLSCPGTLLIVILQGLCVWAGNIAMMYRATGSSLNLTVNYPDKLTLVKWKFNKEIFAEYTPKENYTVLETHLKERVKGAENKIEVTVQDLQPTDSGTFLIIVDGQEKQPLIQRFQVYILNPVTDVQIDKNQTWTESTNSCVINLKCKALGAENLFYHWSGFKNASGAQVQFTLSPVDGAATLTCTATNNVNTESASERVTCYTDQTQAGASLSVLKLISSAVAAFPYLLSTFILLLKCYRARAESDEEDRDTQHAVIEDKASC